MEPNKSRGGRTGRDPQTYKPGTPTEETNLKTHGGLAALTTQGGNFAFCFGATLTHCGVQRRNQEGLGTRPCQGLGKLKGVAGTDSRAVGSVTLPKAATGERSQTQRVERSGG